MVTAVLLTAALAGMACGGDREPPVRDGRDVVSVPTVATTPSTPSTPAHLVERLLAAGNGLALQASRDGSVLAGGWRSRDEKLVHVTLWSVPDGRPVQDVSLPPPLERSYRSYGFGVQDRARMADFTDDASVFAFGVRLDELVGDADVRYTGRLYFLDLRNGGRREMAYEGGPIAFVPGTRRLVTVDQAHSRFVLRNEGGRVVDRSPGLPEPPPDSGPDNAVPQLVAAAPGARVVAGVADSTVWSWTPATDAVRVFSCACGALMADLSADARTVAFRTATGVSVWDVATGHETRRWSTRRSPAQAEDLALVAFDPVSGHVLTDAHGFQEWDPASGHLLRSVTPAGRAGAGQLIPLGRRRLVTYSNSRDAVTTAVDVW